MLQIQGDYVLNGLSGGRFGTLCSLPTVVRLMSVPYMAELSP